MAHTPYAEEEFAILPEALRSAVGKETAMAVMAEWS